ncbi:site-specific integrase [Lacinutrix sp.]|uniref:tyrosine-type recombinase/integrase n=1 Tax=Lacinutrix sp. TaxID=1937692 RepID=UPI0025C1AC4B|nr:site-specific integrase [Lacinutrix sp.]
MANIKFNLISKKNPSNLNVRFYHGKDIDCNTQSNILIDPKLWSNKMQSLKPAVDSKIKQRYLDKVNNIKEYIIMTFNDDFFDGKTIDSKWLKDTIKELQKRPGDNGDVSTYFLAYIKKYIEDSKTRINLKTGKQISPATISKYKSTKKKIEEFERINKIRLRLTDINLKFHKEFTTYLKLEGNYANSLIRKNVSQIKSFIREAKIEGFKTNPEIESSKFTFKANEAIDTYLNVEEITQLFELDLNNNPRLDNVRDLFIIGLWTGLRISDLKRIHDFHFSNNRIIIAGTEKTDDTAEIPIHPQVKAILKKRNNELPRIISDQKFNLYVKDLCEEAGFTDKILGSLLNKETKRKEKGYFEKYKLISSHTCRRSFATNHYGKIDDKTIMAITTHRSHAQFLSYVKTTQKEHLEKLETYWAGQNQ